MIDRKNDMIDFIPGAIVNGTGRIANVAHDGVRVEVDAQLRSISNPTVWVAGNALVHSAQLSPLTTYGGRIVGQDIVKEELLVVLGRSEIPLHTNGSETDIRDYVKK